MREAGGVQQRATALAADRERIGEALERVDREGDIAEHLRALRDVRGTAQRFEETFHDDGPTDMPALLKLYHELGFAGPVRVDHVPTLAGETNDQPGYGSLGRLFAIGYTKGVMQALKIPVD